MNRKRLLASMAALALVVSAFAAAMMPAGADTPSYSGTEWVFFPWVPNGEVLYGNDAWYSTVTIQNLESETITVNTHNTAGGGSNFSTTISPHASKTLPAATLGVGSPGGPLAISANFNTPQNYTDDDERVIPIPPKIGAVMKQVSPNPSPSGAGTTSSHISVDGHTAIPAQDIAWGQHSAFCEDIAGEDNCNNVGAFTFGEPEGGFDGHSYLPIVQTNDGWNSVIHVSNIDASSPSAAAVTMKFYTTDQQGVFSSSNNGIEYTEYLNPGETWTFDLAAQNFPENWVGSVWIVSDYTVAASVNRIKPETDMVITNTAAPSIEAITALDGLGPWSNFQAEADVEGEGDVSFESHSLDGTEGQYEMYGPLVFRNYNGWNTGISIVNITEHTNDVDIKFYGSGGGAAIFQDSLTISPKGQDFVYIPNDPALNGDSSFVGSVLLSSDAPFHAAIDQIKYGSGEALSYMATAAGASAMPEYEAMGYTPALSIPLVQKGSAMTGLGDTSGIQLFNVDPNSSVKVAIEFFNQSGNSSQPTSNAPMTMTLQPYQNATLYTMTFSGMLQNFSGSAVVTPISGGGRVVGVSNNVNYDVQGDGAVAFNMVNSLGQFRFPQSQTQAYADDIVLEPETAELLVGTDHTLTATVYDQFGQVLPGALVNFNVNNVGDPDPSSGSGYSNIDGEVTFTFTNDEAVTNTVTASSGTASDTATVDWFEVPPTLNVDASGLNNTTQGGSGDISFAISNPTTENGGITYEDVRYLITVSGPQGSPGCTSVDDEMYWWFDLTHINFSSTHSELTPLRDSLVCDGSEVFVGEWLPGGEFDLNQGDGETITLTFETRTDTPTPAGTFTVTFELYPVVNGVFDTSGDPIVSDSDTFVILAQENGD